MSILDRIGRQEKKTISPYATFSLTQRGTEKLQQFSGDTLTQILVALETQGTSNMDEISKNSQLSRGQVERMIPRLIRGGYIQDNSSIMGGVEVDRP